MDDEEMRESDRQRTDHPLMIGAIIWYWLKDVSNPFVGMNSCMDGGDSGQENLMYAQTCAHIQAISFPLPCANKGG